MSYIACSPQPYGMGTLVIATLQMGKLRHKEVQQKTQDHAAGGRAGTGTQLCKTLRPLVFTWHPCNGNI